GGGTGSNPVWASTTEHSIRSLESGLVRPPECQSVRRARACVARPTDQPAVARALIVDREVAGSLRGRDRRPPTRPSVPRSGGYLLTAALWLPIDNKCQHGRGAHGAACSRPRRREWCGPSSSRSSPWQSSRGRPLRRSPAAATT